MEYEFMLSILLITIWILGALGLANPIFALFGTIFNMLMLLPQLYPSILIDDTMLLNMAIITVLYSFIMVTVAIFEAKK
jgi:hypothetical protein